jgi:hypothetical protein
MADAAKAARGSFQDIKSGADDMGRAVNVSMMESRHGVMLLGEEFGVHLPRALTTFIAGIGPVGAAMQAAFPFLAIIVGATLLLEHLAKLKAAGEALTESQTKFGTTAANVLNQWNDKILQAEIETDKLNGNHLGALNKTLEQIDHQSMKELVSSFDTVAKAADATFADLKTHWYQWDAGSAGAKNSLEQFRVAYDALLAKEDSKGGTSLLDAKIQREQHILALQQEASRTKAGPSGAGEADMMRFTEARIELQKLGVGYSENEVKAQMIQVGALQDLVKLEGLRAALVKKEGDNAQHKEQNEVGADSDKVARDQAQEQRRAAEEAQKLWEENYRAAVSALQENEREKIDATKQGSAARLAAIDAAIKEEESKGLQENGFYRSLLTSRVELVRQMTEEQAKLEAEAGKESAEHGEKMGELQVQADKQAAQLRMSQYHASAAERVASEQALADEEYQVQMAASAKEIAALDKTGKEYENKLKALQNKQEELVREHENKITQIEEKAEEERNARILSGQQRFDDAMAKDATEVLMRQERMGKMLIQIGDQVIAGMIENAIKSMLIDDMTKERDAAAAARRMYIAGTKFPFPTNIVMAPLLGAAAFASVMAFEEGGIVPGVGKGDTVPAMLEPGEGVLSNRVMDNLKDASRNGGASGGDVHIHHSPTYNVQTIDGDGIRDVLAKHDEEFKQHIANHVRRLNK